MGLILVDGASGFLGSHVVDALVARGARVRTTDRPGAPAASADHVERDLAREPLADLFDGAGEAIHVAGLFDLAASERELERANVHAAERFAAAAAAAGVRRLVHVSSVTVYGRPARTPCAEDGPFRPVSPYEQSKLAGERAVRRAYPSAVVLRPSGIYGPRGRYGLALLMSSLALAKDRGRGHRSLRPSARMTHVHVEDVALACAHLLEARDVEGLAFNCADSDPIAWADLFAFLEREMGVGESAPLRVPPLGARALALLARLLPARTEEANAAMARRWARLVEAHGLVDRLCPRLDAHAYDYWKADHVYDVRALERTGWRAKHKDVREGLRETLQWYVAERWLPA